MQFYYIVLGRESSEKDMSMSGGDKLILKGLKFYGYHGAIPEEKTLGQMFLVDIDAWVSLKKAGVSDNLADTISYVDIFRLALAHLPIYPLRLFDPCLNFSYGLLVGK